MGEGMPGTPGTIGMPSGRGSSRGGRQSEASVFALSAYPRNAVFKLDGGASTAELGSTSSGDASLKADWGKNGQVLKLSLTGQSTKLKDQWKLSSDGQILFVDRSVHSSSGSGSVRLAFRKQGGAGAGAHAE